VAKAKVKAPKQRHFDGLEPPSVPAIDEAAEAFWDAHQRLKESREADAQAGEELVRLMKEHGLPFYECEQFRIDLDTKSKAKVRKRKAEENGDGDA
jgi:hypothetical protein